MIAWFERFIDWITSIVDPLISFFKSVIHGLQTLINMIPIVSTTITSSISYLPSILAAFVAITLSVYILYLIIGRDPGD